MASLNSTPTTAPSSANLTTAFANNANVTNVNNAIASSSTGVTVSVPNRIATPSTVTIAASIPPAAAPVPPTTTTPSNPSSSASQATQPATAGTGNTFYRLKVEDALSYLDQVKFQFEKQPEVYNQFLDIMKEFKSQAIDTPGVISRVSNLFRGHTDLIEGFNTFLPPGYKIEVQENNAVHFTAPNSTSSTLVQPITPAPAPPPAPSVAKPAAAPIQGVKQQQPQPIHNIPIVNSSTKINQMDALAASTPKVEGQHQHVSLTNAGHISSLNTFKTIQTPNLSLKILPNQNANTVAGMHHQQQQQLQHAIAASAAINHQQPAGQQQTAPASQVEFGHAINYVNKIKSRFHNQPDIYKSFLEILHTYQKQQKNLKEVR
jgi:paired amphipathic helix protein Sin3a